MTDLVGFCYQLGGNILYTEVEGEKTTVVSSVGTSPWRHLRLQYPTNRPVFHCRPGPWRAQERGQGEGAYPSLAVSSNHLSPKLGHPLHLPSSSGFSLTSASLSPSLPSPEIIGLKIKSAKPLQVTALGLPRIRKPGVVTGSLR